MAYYLQYDAVSTQRISIPPVASSGTSQDFSFEIELQLYPSGVNFWSSTLLGISSEARQKITLGGQSKSSGAISLLIRAQADNILYLTFIDDKALFIGSPRKIKVESVSGVVSLYLDNVFQSNATTSIAFDRSFNQIGSNQESRETDPVDIYDVNLSINGDTRDYNFTASGGTGTVVPDNLNVANNGTVIGGSQWVAYTSANTAPTANAGVDQTGVEQGSTVTLDATGSTDDVGVSSYAWTQTVGTTVTLSSTTVAQPTFTAPASAETLTFQVEVTDGEGLTSTDTVNISVAAVANSAPTANAGTDQAILGGDSFTLDGSASFDSDGTVASYAWSQVSGTVLTITNPSQAITTVSSNPVSSDETAVFNLVVTDNDGVESTASAITITIAAETTAPVANAGTNQNINSSGGSTTLNGTGSTSNNTITEYRWKQISGAYAKLDDRFTASPSFVNPALSNRVPFSQNIYGLVTQSTPTAVNIPISLSKVLDITYAGAFRIQFTDEVSNTGYSSNATGISEDKLRLFITSHNYENAVAEIVIPTLSMSSTLADLPNATVSQGFATLLSRNTIDPKSNDRIDGYLEYNGSLIITSEKWYDGDGLNSHNMQVLSDSSNLAGGTNTGLLQYEGRARSAGWMAKVPADLVALVGGEFVSGWASNYSISSRYSQGPSLYVFDPQDALNAVAGGVVPSTELLNYPLNENALSVGGNTYLANVDPLWGSEARGKMGFLIPNSNLFMVIGSHGGLNDGVGYKITQDTGNLCGGSCTYTAADQYSYYWLYNINDIVNATNTYDPEPFAFGQWSHPFDDAGDHRVGGGTFDEVNNKLYLTIGGAGTLPGGYASQSLIVVYDLAVKAEEVTAIGTDLTEMVFELKVTDQDGLSSTDTVTVALGQGTDVTAPVISIDPTQTTYTLTVGDAFSAPVGTSTDNVDGSQTITPTGTVDNNTVGTYTLTYSDSDAAGNVANPVVVTVNVNEFVNMAYAQPLPNINRIIFLGASIQAQALVYLNGSSALENYLEQQTGRAFTIVNAAVSGENLTQIATRWDSIKSTYQNDANTLVLVHALGNTISDKGAWGTLTTQEQADLATQYNNLIQNIQTNGNLPAPTRTSYRNYNASSLNSESDANVQGSFLYNQNVLTPALANITVPMGDSTFTYFDWYDVTRNLYTAFRDNIHPNASLSAVLIAYTAQQIINRINGANSLVITRVSDPSLSQNLAPVPSIFTTSGNILNAFETNSSNTVMAIPHIFSDDMYTKVSSLSITGFLENAGGGSNGGALDTSDISQTLTNDIIKDSYAFNSGSTASRLFTASGYLANQELQIEIAAYRDSGANDRVGRYSINSDLSDHILVDASTNATSATAGATMNTGTLTTQADASGNVTLYYAVNVSGFAYLNAAKITPILNVIDVTSPIITVSGSASTTITEGDVAPTFASSASDDTDGVISVTIGGDTVDTNTVGSYTITYNAVDAAGNSAVQITRTVVVQAAEDVIAPVITVSSTQSTTIELGETAPVFAASIDNDSILVIGGDIVDISTVGTYTITYNAVDASGNIAAQVTRVVIVDAGVVSSLYQNTVGNTTAADQLWQYSDNFWFVPIANPETYIGAEYIISDTSGRALLSVDLNDHVVVTAGGFLIKVSDLLLTFTGTCYHQFVLIDSLGNKRPPEFFRKAFVNRIALGK
jgi:hypothetical protein